MLLPALAERLPESVNEETLLDTAHRWTGAADEPGVIERRTAMPTDLQRDTPSEYEARLAWVRAVDAALYMLDLTSAVPRENVQAQVETGEALPA